MEMGKKEMIKDYYIVCKTHMDYGFVDLAKNEIDQIVKKHVSEVIKNGYYCKELGEEYVWTYPSYIVYKALQEDKTGRVKSAIEDGILSWHALPSTMYVGSMSPKLFECTMDISNRLDEMFHIKTKAAKATDVPAYALGVVPLLAKNGVKLLHVGTNYTTPMPKVPKAFRWKCGDSDIAVLYSERDYGGDYVFEEEGFAVKIYVTGDNSPPTNAVWLREMQTVLRREYPNANFHIVNFNDIADKIYALELPVVERDIGNTWSFCVGTDPWKMSQYKLLMRELDKGTPIDLTRLYDNLFLVPEHTWGLEQQFCWKKPYAWYELEKLKGAPFYRQCVASDEEQRDYVRDAAKIMGVPIEEEYEIPDVPFEKEDIYMPFEISCQVYNYDSFYKILKLQYMLEKNEHAIDADFCKPFLEKYPTKTIIAKTVGVYRGEETILKLSFDAKYKKEFGLPDFYVTMKDGDYEILQTEKEPERRPHAFFLKFRDMEEDWELERLGLWTKATELIDGGLLTEIGMGVRNADYEIESLDCSLVCPFGRRMNEYYPTEGLCQDLYFNLYNNVWNCNAPLWYTKAAKYRFRFHKRG